MLNKPWQYSLALIYFAFATPVFGQSAPMTLEQQLLKIGIPQLAKEARKDGNPTRGALVFYQRQLACTKCHDHDNENPLGPNLTKFEKKVDDAYLIEAVLHPSKAIRKGYETITVITTEGKTISGLLAEETPTQIVLRDPARDGALIKIDRKNVDEKLIGKTSVMPVGQVNALSNKQQFLDLMAYLFDISENGPKRALALRPPASFLIVQPLPEYENRIDHAGMIASLNAKSFQRGEALYMRVCANCHGTLDQPGSMPTSLRFASGQFKNGSDAHSMYRTITHGYGMMVPQTWMVPQQKYDVIHYIREHFLKKHNPKQYVGVNETYLASLPKGDTSGPAPSNVEPWSNMDYGQALTATFEIGRSTDNFAYKGIAVRLDPGPGGVTRGNHFMMFDEDTMRVAAAWSGKGFCDYNSIMFNGRHAIHPSIVGKIELINPPMPGWGNPKNGSFSDPRIVGRDGKHYGPLPRDWSQFKGQYRYGDKVIVSYTVGNTSVLEMPGMEPVDGMPLYTRTFNIGPRDKDMILQVAMQNSAAPLSIVDNAKIAVLPSTVEGKKSAGFQLDGQTSVSIANSKQIDLFNKDFTIRARIKTKNGGTILSKAPKSGSWQPNAKALFVRGGKLVYDIGWVGAVTSRQKVNDNRWHDIAMTYRANDGKIQLFIDGKLDREGSLKPKEKTPNYLVRLGVASANFPEPQSYFDGEIEKVQFYASLLNEEQIAKNADARPLAQWNLTKVEGDALVNNISKRFSGTIVRGMADSAESGPIVAGLSQVSKGFQWQKVGDHLRLRIPAGKESLRFTLWQTRLDKMESLAKLQKALPKQVAVLDLAPLTKGGPANWNTTLQTTTRFGNDSEPFAVDTLTQPQGDPWFSRMRFSGLDFFKNNDRMAVCSWDGNVWLVDGINKCDSGLTWRKIASGLFQPLGLKIVDDTIYVCCRDQIVILRDLNGDGETDFYECFNGDHQVTDHFHEFAMGLQTDEAGNFYYSRAARHALTALVPHHGTLIKVSKDGSKSTILATGFRAPNGVCLNPDGTFIVTDQEGHWNPKNRINWVEVGKFYGNMFGYHNVTDTSDDAMEQPLCWITNSFDRSPSELLWVDSPQWGPLKGSLLNLSYGYGKVFVVPHEKVNGQMQGGMSPLPISQFPTGVMRARFHPENGQLYACGMFAWGGNQTSPGGIYRLRYTNQPVHLPIELHATTKGMTIGFSGKLDRKSAEDPDAYSVKVWSLKRSAGYGSKHYDEKFLTVTKAKLAEDGKTVYLTLPDIAPTWCMEIRYRIRSAEGTVVDGVIHNTIHNLAKKK